VIALLGLLGMLVGEQAVGWWRGHVDLAQAVTRLSTHGTHQGKPERKQDT
jgi:xanthosine utilization system XapX-like protein